MDKIARLLTFAELFYKLSVDFGRIAQKVSLPIVVHQDPGETTLIVVQDVGDKLDVRGSITLGQNDAEMSEGHSRQDWGYKISAVWASSPMIGAYLFGAALAAAQRVVPDSSVTPAAQLVVKNYWSRYKDNPAYIVPEVLAEANWNVNSPWLRAGYLGGPVGSAYDPAFNMGYEITRDIPSDKIADMDNALFQYYYGSKDLTKTLDPQVLRETNWLQQQGVMNPEEVLQQLERGETVDFSTLKFRES